MTGLFLAKLQVLTIASTERFYNGVRNGICLWLQNIADLHLEKFEAFAINNPFVSGGIGVKVLEMLNSAVGLKSADESLESAVPTRSNRNSN